MVDSNSRQPQDLELLFEISQMLEQSLDLRRVARPVLKALADHMYMLRGTLTLVDRERKEISIEAAIGLSARQQERGRYQLGEGITGRVIASGEAVVIPRISNEPEFLDRTGARSNEDMTEISFICVPVKLDKVVLGALSVDQAFHSEERLERGVHLLTVVASMIARAAGLRIQAHEAKRALEDENRRLQKALRTRFRPTNLIGNSHGMQAVYDLIAQVAPMSTTVLLRGESGTGKELAAHAIHYNSPRADRPFIKVNCAALSETIIESELFGHERGSFTGATAQRKGRFELAHRGTVFLDEIGDFSPSTQIKLLRVLQEREFERVGGVETIKVDVRIVTATNRDLETAIEEGVFRQDLYYRLNVFPIHLPPLRERQTDIVQLADHFVEKYNRMHNKHVKRISTPAIDMLVSYHWPGNVRELENCIERALLISTDDVVHGHHLPPSLQTAEASGTGLSSTLQDQLDALEREIILEALKSTQGNMAKAARILGVSERIMGLRVKKHEIAARRFRTKM